jgi:hypothetical protein
MFLLSTLARPTSLSRVFVQGRAGRGFATQSTMTVLDDYAGTPSISSIATPKR